MTSKSKFRPSPATAIACVALFLALAGTAFALPKASVGSKQIANGTVRTVDLGPNSVKSPKIADGTIVAEDLGDDSVDFEEIALNAVDTGEIAAGAVGTEELSENAVTSPKVLDQSLTANDLGAASVGSSELGTTVVRTNSKTLKAGDAGGISVACLGNEQVLSGGGSPSHYGVEMTTTRPNGNGWTYNAYNKNGSDATITAYALCLS